MIKRIKMMLVAAAAALLVAPASWAQLSTYTQDFEALNPVSSLALSGAGFLVSGVVFDGDTVNFPPYGAFKFFYGNFAAPNGNVAFSGIATGEGGAPQGLNVLNVFSDYQCCANTSEGHFDTTSPIDYVQSNVYQQQTIALADIGTTWSFKFDAKSSATGCASDPVSDCVAFIRTLNGGTQTNFITFDAQTLTSTWSTQTLSIVLTDPALNGQQLQIGFQSTSKQFGNTGVFYDNIFFGLDTDGDGAPNVADNCRNVANPNQVDSDGDGFGNRCDGDMNNSGSVNAFDTPLYRAQIGQPSVPPLYNKADINTSGGVNAFDTPLYRALVGFPVGPGAGP